MNAHQICLLECAKLIGVVIGRNKSDPVEGYKFRPGLHSFHHITHMLSRLYRKVKAFRSDLLTYYIIECLVIMAMPALLAITQE
jgi:hypothetical protein